MNLTGEDDRKVLQKRESLLKWIGDNGGYINRYYSLQGLVLAPNDIGGNPSSTTFVPNTDEESMRAESCVVWTRS